MDQLNDNELIRHSSKTKIPSSNSVRVMIDETIAQFGSKITVFL